MIHHQGIRFLTGKSTPHHEVTRGIRIEGHHAPLPHWNLPAKRGAFNGIRDIANVHQGRQTVSLLTHLPRQDNHHLGRRIRRPQHIQDPFHRIPVTLIRDGGQRTLKSQWTFQIQSGHQELALGILGRRR